MKKMILLLLTMTLFHTGCSNQEKKEKTFEVDQEIIDGTGAVNFARAHYVMGKTDAMNRVLENKLIAHIKDYCEEKKLKKKILRKYNSQTDFVTLRYDYKYNRNVRVYEFQCIH